MLAEKFITGPLPNNFFSAQFGLEKESLRITPEGKMAFSKHPVGLGHPIQNQNITTDYAECQLEMITDPSENILGALTQLKEIHKKVHENLENNELLWPMSTPCILPDDEKDIPIARYGNDEEAQKREIYRKGLALRYGKQMQTLSGIHYNFSFGEEFLNFFEDNKNIAECNNSPLKKSHLDKEGLKDFKNKLYMSLSRNFLREFWLLIYLFGAAPFHHKSYKCKLPGGIANPKHATSLRMSRCGYFDAKEKVQISWNSLKEVITNFRHATSTSDPDYEKFGLYNENKQQHQLNTNLIQIENEFYSPIRVKPKMESGLSVADSLEKNGIEYIEIRIVDVNPLFPIGIGERKMRFLHIFLTYCALKESPKFTNEDRSEMNRNRQLVATKGREKNIFLRKQSKDISLQNWGGEILNEMEKIGKKMGTDYEETIDWAKKALTNISLLPSEKIAREMKQTGEDYVEFGIRKAREHREIFEKKAIHVLQ